MPPPRKQGKVHRIRVTFTLREGETDEDLIAFFLGLPSRNRARAIMNALLDGGGIESQREVEEQKRRVILKNILSENL